MPGNKYNGNPAIPTSRLERLLRDREIRKSNKASHSNEATENNKGIELRLREGDSCGASSYVEQYLEGAATAQALGEGWERPEGRPFRQRLLVVANR
ncbi:hypothetical protein CsSME_00027037 [Camellia sinensis var. sinensis]